MTEVSALIASAMTLVRATPAPATPRLSNCLINQMDS